MALPTSGNLSLSQVRTEFGAPVTTPLSAFLRGGAWVPDTAANAGAPTALPISLRQLLGASAIVNHSVMADDIFSFTFTATPQTVSGTSTAVVSNGVGPFTFAWSILTGTGYSLTAGTTTATVTATRPSSEGFGVATGTVRCSVTDTGNGNFVSTVDVPVNLFNEM